MNLGLSGAGGVEGGAGVAVQEHVIPGWLAGLNGGRMRHGAATASGARQQSGTARLVPEQIRAGLRRVLLGPVMAMAEQLPPPPATQGVAADREAAAQSWGFHLGGALGIELVMAHGCLPSASSQRCRCQSRWERRQPGFLGTRWRPGLSRPLRLIANSVERLIASWAQSSSVVSQGFEGDMAAEAAGVGAAGEATHEGCDGNLAEDNQKIFGWWGSHSRAPATMRTTIGKGKHCIGSLLPSQAYVGRPSALGNTFM